MPVLVVCGFNILYYGSISAQLSEKPFNKTKTEPWFQFSFGFVICFSALSLQLTHFNENGASKRLEVETWKLLWEFLHWRSENRSKMRFYKTLRLTVKLYGFVKFRFGSVFKKPKPNRYFGQSTQLVVIIQARPWPWPRKSGLGREGHATHSVTESKHFFRDWAQTEIVKSWDPTDTETVFSQDWAQAPDVTVSSADEPIH